MYKVYLAVGKLAGIKEVLESLGEEDTLLQENFIKDLAEIGKDFEKYLQMVESTLDLDQVREGRFMIKPEFDDALGELREELDDLETKIQSAFNNCGNELGLETGKVLKLEHSSIHGYYFRLTMKAGVIKVPSGGSLFQVCWEGILSCEEGKGISWLWGRI